MITEAGLCGNADDGLYCVEEDGIGHEFITVFRRDGAGRWVNQQTQVGGMPPQGLANILMLEPLTNFH